MENILKKLDREQRRRLEVILQRAARKGFDYIDERPLVSWAPNVSLNTLEAALARLEED